MEIVVADTGCGISSAKLEGIFREFEQVESSMPRSGENQGLGEHHPNGVVVSLDLPLFRSRPRGGRSNCRATRWTTSSRLEASARLPILVFDSLCSSRCFLF